MGVVWAIIVTRDRRELLRECLAALGAQQRPADHVLVVDNASSDGTVEMVLTKHPDVELLSLAVNEGGAGGFHEGMRRAHGGGAEWLWVMDDDTVPEPGALSELLAAPQRLNEPAAFLASRAVARRPGASHERPLARPLARRSSDRWRRKGGHARPICHLRLAACPPWGGGPPRAAAQALLRVE